MAISPLSIALSDLATMLAHALNRRVMPTPSAVTECISLNNVMLPQIYHLFLLSD